METFLLHLKHAGIHNKYNKYRKTKLDEISTLTDNFSKRTNVVLKIKIINKQIITPSCNINIPVLQQILHLYWYLYTDSL